MRGYGGPLGRDSLRVGVEQRDSTAWVAPVGELDLATSATLKATLAGLLSDASVRRVVLDLRGLSFLDSTGLETIIRADAASRRDGFDLTLIKAPPSVHRVFLLSGLEKHLVMVGDPDEVELLQD